MRRVGTLTAWTMAALLTAAGCGSKQADPAELMASGRKYVEEGKLAEAAIQFRNVIQQDPMSGEARFELAGILVKNGDAQGAYREFVRAADLLPNRVDAQLRAAQMNLLGGRFEDAKTRAEKVIALDAGNIEAHLVIGTALAGLKQVDLGLQQIEEAIKLDPQRGMTYANLGVMRLAQGDKAEAEKAFLQAVELDQKSIPARIALINFYWTTQQADKVESTVKDALAVDPRNLTLNRLMAYLYLATNRAADAEPFLKTAADRSLDPSARAVLADYYLQTGREADAMAVLDKLAADPKGRAVANVRKAVIYFKRGEKQTAYSTLEGVLGTTPKDVSALLTKAEFLGADQKLDQALVAAEAAVAAAPAAVPAQYTKARVLAALGRSEDAVATYNEVLKLSPTMLNAKLDLARLYLSSRRFDDARQLAQEAATSQPNNPEVVLLYARTQMASGGLDNAAESMKKLAADYPQAAIVHSQLGTMSLLKNDRRTARASYDKALALDKTNVEALTGLLTVDVAEKKIDAARARIKGALESTPDSPALLLIAARTDAVAGDLTAAEASLRRAVQIDPNRLEGYALLGQLLVRQNKVDAAMKEFDQVLARNPKATWAHTLNGMLLQSTNRVKDAEARYRQALAVDPKAAVAANNLAWLSAEGGGDLNVALQLAQTARAQLPESPDVADTLGWIYYKMELHPQAVTAFKDAVEKQPARADFQYHLGLASAKTSDFKQAREALEEGLRLAPNAPEAAEARAALSRLTVLGS